MIKMLWQPLYSCLFILFFNQFPVLFIILFKNIDFMSEKKSLRGKKNNRIQSLIMAEIILAALSYMQINPQLNGFNYSKKA